MDHHTKKEKDKKVDKAVDMTFPASDPVAAGKPTANEPLKKPVSREAPLPSREEIERAQRGEGHKKN